MKLLQIVPGFGEVGNGLLDYAHSLEAELLKKGITSFYEWNDAEKADAIFLNYSGYGYQKRGVPIRFYSQLRKLIQQKRIPLYVYFHEVYAGRERIFTSSYWLHPVQKELYKRLYQISTASFCGNEVIQNIIRSENKNSSKLYFAPLFSNIPVLEHEPDFEKRKDIAVVFGTAGRREEVYQNVEAIKLSCKTLGITSLIDIGDGFEQSWADSLSIEVIAKGRLDKNEVAENLRSCKYAFISYPNNIFGKSSIFAAYAGNAMTIVNFDTSLKEMKDGLLEGQHYVSAATARGKSIIKPADLSAEIFRWYQQRSIEVHAQIVGDVLLKGVTA